MMSHAHELITAIQTCIPGRLRAVIDRLVKLSDDEVQHLPSGDQVWSRKNRMNDRLTGSLDITALHLAAKAYAAHREDEHLAAAFDEMVGDLLTAGASPFLEIGGKRCKEILAAQEVICTRGGQTVAEVCEGKLPPTLAAWFAENCDNTATTKASAPTKHSSTIIRERIKSEAFRKCREELEAQDLGKQLGNHHEQELQLTKKHYAYAPVEGTPERQFGRF